MSDDRGFEWKRVPGKPGQVHVRRRDAPSTDPGVVFQGIVMPPRKKADDPDSKWWLVAGAALIILTLWAMWKSLPVIFWYLYD